MKNTNCLHIKMDFVFLILFLVFFIELIKIEMAKAEAERILHCHIIFVRNSKDFPALITSNGTGFTFHRICHVIFIYHNQYHYDNQVKNGWASSDGVFFVSLFSTTPSKT